MNIYRYNDVYIAFILFLTIKRFNLILSVLVVDILSILICSIKYYLVSRLDVAFRLYQHLDDLRISPGCCPMNWRPSILNHFPPQNMVRVFSSSFRSMLYINATIISFYLINSKLTFQNV